MDCRQPEQPSGQPTPEDPPISTSGLPDSVEVVHLLNTGKSLLDRFWQRKSADDLEQAIQTVEEAIHLGNSHDNLSRGFNLLGIALWERFKKSRKIEDIDRAVDAAERAVELTSEDHT